MNKSIRPTLIILVLIAISVFAYWLLPISGQLAYISDSAAQTNTWPQVNVVSKDENTVEVVVQDVTPWTFVHLEQLGTEAVLVEHGSQNEQGVWQWVWQVQGKPTTKTLNLYHSCDRGCQLWTTTKTAVVTPTANPPLTPTKLGLVFANPDRDWHNRQGWTVEITYANLAEEPFWGIDDLARRVQQAEQNGLNVLVRIEYDQGQSIPPTNDFIALDTYLRYAQRLARDARLANVHGFIIGSNFNTNGANAQAADAPVTPEWYAQVFNGYSTQPENDNNVLATIRQENPQVRVLVGPVNPWNSDQTGNETYEIDVPWLNYMNSVVTYIDQAAHEKMTQGISNVAPDGFAIQAFGRVDDTSLLPEQRAEEPFLTLQRPEWGEAQVGFQIYKDWLAIINQYEQIKGKPVYINASNTFDSETGRVPTENYPLGWLSNALNAVNQEPQIQALCWFMDGFAHDEQWEQFSLTDPHGLLIDAAQEFDALLQGE